VQAITSPACEATYLNHRLWGTSTYIHEYTHTYMHTYRHTYIHAISFHQSHYETSSKFDKHYQPYTSQYTHIQNLKYKIHDQYMFHELQIIQYDKFFLLYKHFHIVPPIIGILCTEVQLFHHPQRKYCRIRLYRG
jgi:hypothetical protein